MSEPLGDTAPEGLAVETPAEVDAGFDGSAEIAQLRAQLDAAQKRATFAEEGYAAARKPAWIQEAQRLHPELSALVGVAGLSSIEATSRRSFQRKAEELAALHGPSINALRAMKEQASSAVEEARQAAAEQARAEVISAWGKPSSDSIGPPPAPDKKAETLQRLVR